MKIAPDHTRRRSRTGIHGSQRRGECCNLPSMIPRCSLLFRLLLLPALAFALAGCGITGKKERIVGPPGDLENQSGDVSFQAFVTRLRAAAAKRDTVTLSMMMTPDFGYSWAAGGEGPGVFDYWDARNLWPDLQAVLRERFVPSGNYMVAPAEVTLNPDYPGFRAGLRLVNGSWRFSYFVPAPPNTGR